MYNVKDIGIEDLTQWLADDGRDVHVVDVRTPQEYMAGSIDGADPIPLHLIPVRIQDLPKDKDLVFICRTGARSAQATAFVTGQGFDKAYNLRGGLVDWVRNRLPLGLAKTGAH